MASLPAASTPSLTHLQLAERAFIKLMEFRSRLDGWTNAGKLFDLCPDAGVLMLGLKATMTSQVPLIEDVGKLTGNFIPPDSAGQLSPFVELLKHKLMVSGLGALITVEWEKLETETDVFAERMNTLSSLAALLVACIDVSQGF